MTSDLSLKTKFLKLDGDISKRQLYSATQRYYGGQVLEIFVKDLHTSCILNNLDFFFCQLV